MLREEEERGRGGNGEERREDGYGRVRSERRIK